jgi:hypothetical protein
MKSVIIYTYFKSPSNNYNLSFFAKRELSCKEDIDYIIVVNGHECGVELPELPNLTVLKRDNVGFDYGGHSAALDFIKSENKVYDYYFFMNSGVIGPIVPHYFKKTHWSSLFIEKITDKVKLVGTTIVCLASNDSGGYGPKVEGFFFMTDKIGLDAMIAEKTIFCNHPTKFSVIVNGEYGMSNCMFKNGYSVDCMISKYQGIDWSDSKNYKMNNNRHPSRKNYFYGKSLNPYEVIFYKWFWNDDGPVNFDIIDQYVNQWT